MNDPESLEKIAAFQRWLVQLRDPERPAYTYIRRVEQGFDAKRNDTKKVLRGVRVAVNLVMTRQLMFFQLIGRRKAQAISLEAVAQQYPLEDVQTAYRAAMEAWKTARKKAS